MAIRIFENDPDARPRKPLDDIVGRFRSGALLNGSPTALEDWRVTTDDPEVADLIQELMGGSAPAEWVTKGDDNIEVYTESNRIDVVLDGPNGVKTGMALWGRNGLIHKCDGEVTTEGEPCPMAGKSVQERKEAARAGYGCEPNIQVYFRIKGHEDLGKFRFFSGSWTFAGEVGDAEDKLATIDGPAEATLRLEVVEYTTKKGRDVRYTKPVLDVKGPAESGDAA